MIGIAQRHPCLPGDGPHGCVFITPLVKHFQSSIQDKSLVCSPFASFVAVGFLPDFITLTSTSRHATDLIPMLGDQ